MAIARREFLRLSGGAAVGVAALEGSAGPPAAEAAEPLKTQGATQVHSICYYCAVGCGINVSVANGKVIAIEGDPEHPINRGTLCSKAQAFTQALDHERRLRKARYRAPGSDHWEDKPLDWALDQIALRIKATRDATFEEQEDGVTVNRTRALASLGGAILNNEECYLLAKLMRGLGVVYLEHQARI